MREAASQDRLTLPLDSAAIRADFPLLHERAAQGPLHYLDNAASAQKRATVIDAVTDCYRRFCAPVYRGLYPLAGEATAL